MEDTSGLSGPGHYNKVALLMRWRLIEVSLYLVNYHLFLTSHSPEAFLFNFLIQQSPFNYILLHFHTSLISPLFCVHCYNCNFLGMYILTRTCNIET